MGKSMSWGCSTCEAVFPSKEELVKHIQTHKVVVSKAESVKPGELVSNPGQVVAPQSPVIKSIKLKYVYEGQCTKCNSPISTIELDVKDSHVVVAYCQRCNLQLDQKEVSKL
jgi:predicted rRNA methylase YqxC with S4 and FtsJ domains